MPVVSIRPGSNSGKYRFVRNLLKIRIRICTSYKPALRSIQRQMVDLLGALDILEQGVDGPRFFAGLSLPHQRHKFLYADAGIQMAQAGGDSDINVFHIRGDLPQIGLCSGLCPPQNGV